MMDVLHRIALRVAAEYDQTLSKDTISEIRKAFLGVNGTYSNKSDFIQKIQNFLGSKGISWDQGISLTGDKGIERVRIGHINVDNPFGSVTPIINAILAFEWERNEDESFTMTARLLTKSMPEPKLRKKYLPGPYTFNPDLYEED
jgi:hypothetical protein